MRAFTGFPDEQKCELYNIDGRFFQAKTRAKSRVGDPRRWRQQVVGRNSRSASAVGPKHPPLH